MTRTHASRRLAVRGSVRAASATTNQTPAQPAVANAQPAIRMLPANTPASASAAVIAPAAATATHTRASGRFEGRRNVHGIVTATTAAWRTTSSETARGMSSFVGSPPNRTSAHARTSAGMSARTTSRRPVLDRGRWSRTMPPATPKTGHPASSARMWLVAASLAAATPTRPALTEKQAAAMRTSTVRPRNGTPRSGQVCATLEAWSTTRRTGRPSYDIGTPSGNSGTLRDTRVLAAGTPGPRRFEQGPHLPGPSDNWRQSCPHQPLHPGRSRCPLRACSSEPSTRSVCLGSSPCSSARSSSPTRIRIAARVPSIR